MLQGEQLSPLYRWDGASRGFHARVVLISTRISVWTCDHVHERPAAAVVCGRDYITRRGKKGTH